MLPQQPHHQPGPRDPLAERDHQHSDPGAGAQGQRGAAGAERSKPADKVFIVPLWRISWFIVLLIYLPLDIQKHLSNQLNNLKSIMCFPGLTSRTSPRDMSGRWASSASSISGSCRSSCATSTRPRRSSRTRSLPCKYCECQKMVIKRFLRIL